MIVKMNRMTLLGIEDQRKDLISSLMKLGIVEISTLKGKDYQELANNPLVQDQLSTVEGKIETIFSSIESLNKYCPEKKGLFKVRREVTASEFDETVQYQEKVFEAVQKIIEQEERLIALKAEENKLNNLGLSLLPWKALTVPLETVGTQRTIFQIGTIPSQVQWDEIEAELVEKAPCSYLKRIGSDKDQHYVSLLIHNENAQESLSYLKSRGFTRVVFSGLSGTAAENIAAIDTRLEENRREHEEVIVQIQKRKADRKAIEILYDSLLMEKGRIEATGRLLKTKRSFLMKGWIPEELAMAAKEKLESKYTVCVEIEKTGEDEEFPVLLENRGIAEAGEPVSGMYSLPNSREIDPNPVMSPFFILFFGLMLSDGGYGILLVLAASIILKHFKLEDSTRRFMKLIFYCGIATIFWGIMFGSWFGLDSLTKYAFWMNIVEEPRRMLSWSLLFGIVHMFFGMGMKAANLIRRGKYLDALFDVGFWYIFYTGAVLILLPYAPAVDPVKVAPLVNIGQYIFIAGALLLLFTQGREKKNILGKFFGGISSLYSLVGFMSDALSYSRLLALGLATGIIASIVNQMSVMFDIPIVLKIVLAAAILLVGHVINFAINAMGAYVHSCRLQYLEFFGKFFTGGGEAFRPLKANTKYITVKADADHYQDALSAASGE